MTKTTTTTTTANIQKFLILDTETVKMDGQQLVYDVGLLVIDRNGIPYEEHSFLVRGIFNDIKLMSTAYYSNRYNKYLDELASGDIKIVQWRFILETIKEVIERHQIDTICAYNELFDSNAMKNTTSYFFKEENWLPDGIEHFCIWNAACTSFLNKDYIAVAREKGWVTEKDNVMTSAEKVYRYISNLDDFEESHTGLADCKIEAQILLHVLNSGKDFDSTPKAFPMRVVFELDRVWQVRDLESKEEEAEELIKEVKRLYACLKGRFKTISKKRAALNYEESSTEEIENILSVTPITEIKTMKAILNCRNKNTDNFKI